MKRPKSSPALSSSAPAAISPNHPQHSTHNNNNTSSSKRKRNIANSPPPLRIGFLHPDLGIGGAERLVVDAALGLQNKGHHVTIWTAHHNPNSKRSFKETHDGTLDVKVHGDFIPRHIFGKFHVIMAILRNMWAACAMLLFDSYDIIFCDQISMTNPILKLSRGKVLFYCHFPDQLLTKRNSVLKKLYRFPVDFLEQVTTGMADKVLVNSKFTATVFEESFPRLKKLKPEVLYPSLNLNNYDKEPSGIVPLGDVPPNKDLLVSINRYERKKNIHLAIAAFAELKKRIKPEQYEALHLVIAGGYDIRVSENVEYHKELEEIVKDFKLQGRVSFLKSFTEDQRHVLLKRCLALIYTPSYEHFGIGPLEGMYAARPVIAVNNGGPLETVKDGETGYLCESTPAAFCEAMRKLVVDRKKAKDMGDSARAWVKSRFNLEVFSNHLDHIVREMASHTNKH
eukprot:TRINITY_DN4122_c0_g1_i1.p1 TRINITY_DN4122_c0_g1~~TRINITY_DN4122_c0_g1_i1.p1  ORF type:complete len:475 (+),score=91.40 TRINITY_DN4122_c0_g1_i1:66-1427(+)